MGEERDEQKQGGCTLREGGREVRPWEVCRYAGMRRCRPKKKRVRHRGGVWVAAGGKKDAERTTMCNGRNASSVCCKQQVKAVGGGQRGCFRRRGGGGGG